jgi:hypothetical protein
LIYVERCAARNQLVHAKIIKTPTTLQEFSRDGIAAMQSLARAPAPRFPRAWMPPAVAQSFTHTTNGSTTWFGGCTSGLFLRYAIGVGKHCCSCITTGSGAD